MKKRIIAALLAGVMAFSLTACGGSGEEKKKEEGGKEETMKVAMVTDSGDITDQSFNQTTYETCKAWSEENKVEFNYFKPESDSDEARSASIDQAVADGANVVVLPGYLFAKSVVDQSKTYGRCCSSKIRLQTPWIPWRYVSSSSKPFRLRIRTGS